MTAYDPKRTSVLVAGAAAVYNSVLTESHKKDDLSMIPPWQKYPEIPRGSVGWRMGEGETYWNEFDVWFARKHPDAKRQYAEEHPEPSGWAGFYARKGVSSA
jgi:hypothetical protein